MVEVKGQWVQGRSRNSRRGMYSMGSIQCLLNLYLSIGIIGCGRYIWYWGAGITLPVSRTAPFACRRHRTWVWQNGAKVRHVLNMIAGCSSDQHSASSSRAFSSTCPSFGMALGGKSFQNLPGGPRWPQFEPWSTGTRQPTSPFNRDCRGTQRFAMVPRAGLQDLTWTHPPAGKCSHSKCTWWTSGRNN